MFVGSIKTVIGHTEGTAGLAAVLKTSLALQNATVPPNLLFNELNPAVRPFYNDLEIATTAQEWPRISNAKTCRASVNSFGFGGANAHAILESYNSSLTVIKSSVKVSGLVPFNFSASSDKSLIASLVAYSAYLKTHNTLNLRDLSWTLNCRRSTLPFRLSFTATNIDDLTTKLEAAAESSTEIVHMAQTPMFESAKIIGIFTGQGAQWVQMGTELLDSCPLAIECISNLDMALQSIRQADRPNWLLREEIMKDSTSSRIGEALFSQTICTALQIILVDLIHAAGIQFDTVVGHSSGEIAAAYAAGYLCASDAIKIAYYRGWSMQYASTENRIRGAMMVAETSFADANELCAMPSLNGRICVAASNSTQSVTLSGDIDAIHEAMDIFDDEKKFNRLLKVDKAYHSHHMIPCVAPYIQGLQNAAIRPRHVSGSVTKWISSVHAKDITDVEDLLTDTYWSKNMTRPVLYSHAISLAASARGPFDMAIEIGPHPALKGPTLQTILEVSGQDIPYSGTLIRGKSGTESFASMLGSVWIAFGASAVNYQQFNIQTAPRDPLPNLLKSLPTYQWDHSRTYWHESRISTSFSSGNQTFHPLLGVKCPDGTSKELRWRNYLHQNEIPWLMHHKVQGQMVFPAAGYVSAAMEIIANHYGIDSIEIVDFQDFTIDQALVLENSGTEIIFAFTIISTNNNTATAVFNCYSDANKGSSSMVLHASARAQIILGNAKLDSLPFRDKISDSFLKLEAERFYSAVSDLGFGYTGPFYTLSSISRKMDEATGMIAVPDDDGVNPNLIIHPASLDGAFQSIMLAYSFPGDGRLRTIYLPTRIDHIRINPSGCRAASTPGTALPFYSSVLDGRFTELSGDVSMYSSDGCFTIIQLEGLHTTPLTPLSSNTDIPMFTEVKWAPEIPALGEETCKPELNSQDLDLLLDLERVALFYLKQLVVHFELSRSSEISLYHHRLLSYAEHCISQVKSCQHRFAQPIWVNDTKEDISTIIDK